MLAALGQHERQSMTDEHELRLASDDFLARVERLDALEGRKRELRPGTPEMIDVAHQVEALAREVLDLAKRQTDLATAVAADPTLDMPPIAIIAPRPLPVILAEWREAERRLDAEPPGTAGWEIGRANVDRLRDEYARAFQAHT